MFITNFYFNMFRASLCPYSGEQRPCYCIWCVDTVLLDVVVAVVGRCLVGCEHCEGFCSTELVVLDVVGSGCGALSCGV